MSKQTAFKLINLNTGNEVKLTAIDPALHAGQTTVAGAFKSFAKLLHLSDAQIHLNYGVEPK